MTSEHSGQHHDHAHHHSHSSSVLKSMSSNVIDPVCGMTVKPESLHATDLNGIRYRFFAGPVEIETAPGVELTLSAPGERIAVGAGRFSYFVNKPGLTLSLSTLPGVATFFYRGRKLDLPQGFRTVWKTRPLAP